MKAHNVRFRSTVRYMYFISAQGQKYLYTDMYFLVSRWRVA